jgi:hypothetical protein
MPLFWIVHRVNGEPRVYITEASSTASRHNP